MEKEQKNWRGERDGELKEREGERLVIRESIFLGEACREVASAVEEVEQTEQAGGSAARRSELERQRCHPGS